MPLIQTTPPALEPVTLGEAKAHLRIDTTTEDLLIAALITTARQHIEQTLSMALINQSWSLFLDRWPDIPHAIKLPLSPVSQLTAVRLYGPDDTPMVLDPANLQFDPGPPARVAERNATASLAAVRPLAAIEVAFVAGFGAQPNSVPQPIRQALLQMVAHLHANRESCDFALIPDIAMLLAPWRQPRL